MADRGSLRIVSPVQPLDWRARKRTALVAETTIAELTRLYLEGLGDTSTAPTARSVFDLYILPAFGELKAHELGRDDVFAWIEALKDPQRDLANNYVRKIHGFLHRALQIGVDRQLLPANPASRPPNLPRKEPRATHAPELELPTLAEVLRLISDRARPLYRRVFWSLQALAGLRHGEAMVLRYGDLELGLEPLGRITISRCWGGDPPHEQPWTKTGKVRHVPIHDELLLPLILESRADFVARFGRPPAAEDLVVAHRDRKTKAPTYYPESSSSRHWHKALVAHGLSIETLDRDERRLHALRHFFITTLVDAGIAERTVRAMTHVPEKRDAFSHYVHTRWPRRCQAVLALQGSLQMSFGFGGT